MAKITIGKRRLYDALGVNIDVKNEIFHKVEFTNGKAVSIYLGPNPPLGILSVEGSQYYIPGRNNNLSSYNTKHETPCFLEISFYSPREIPSNQISLLKQEDKETADKLLKEVSDTDEHLLDAISGALALLVHRQLVLKPLVENPFINGDFKDKSLVYGPAMEILESLSTNANTAPQILKLLKTMANTSELDLNKGGTTLHWLLKAWKERDHVTKFMYLFIPLESVLPSTVSTMQESKAEIAAIEALIEGSDAPNKTSLLQFIDRTKTKYGPTLNARFETFARGQSIPEWELDVKAFKKFNRMRNLLLHAGKNNVCSLTNIKENTRSLEDLVERYVSLSLLGTANVYPSKWRPVRQTQPTP